MVYECIEINPFETYKWNIFLYSKYIHYEQKYNITSTKTVMKETNYLHPFIEYEQKATNPEVKCIMDHCFKEVNKVIFMYRLNNLIKHFSSLPKWANRFTVLYSFTGEGGHQLYYIWPHLQLFPSPASAVAEAAHLVRHPLGPSDDEHVKGASPLPLVRTMNESLIEYSPILTS